MICPHCQAENPEITRFCGNCGATLAGASPSPTLHTKTLETQAQVTKPGMVIAGKYRIVEEIGQGGMGIVYKTDDLKLKRSVALKFLPPHLMDSPELKERFLIEAQAAAALNHPNICVIYEVGEDEARPYIAMEFVEGETLKGKLRQGPLSASEALSIASQVAAGLAEAHGKGIIHRDIKSANIMVTAKGQAKVMDFGLAKLQGGSSLTRSQTTLGTVAYMSPEQARGGDLDARTDIWSLGVVLYEMLAGKMPFRGDHDQAVILSILHHEPESLKRVRPDAPPGLEEIVVQALAKKPGNRYQTMEELREDVEAVAEGLKPLRAKYRPARKIFGIRTAYVYGAVVIVLAAILGLNIGGLQSKLRGRAAPAPAIRLAVLPFENLSADPEQEWFSDGMTQEMIAQLGRLHPETLSVIARTSVMHYKKTNTPLDQIGRELNVGFVLEGSTRREGMRVRITAELVKVKDQTQLWSDSIEREYSGILDLQNEVAQEVAGALALKLLPAEQARLANAKPVNPEAYEACLKGDEHANHLTPGELDTALEYYELALKKDPDYAPAYAGIAYVWLDRNQMGYTAPRDGGPKAKAAALKALALDESLAEAHFALADVYWLYEWDWAGAEAEFKRAIKLSPNSASADYSHYLMTMKRPEEALAEIQRALALDPLDGLIPAFYAMVLESAGRYDESIAQFRKALRMSPGLPFAHWMLSGVFFIKGLDEESLAELKAYYAGDDQMEEALTQGYAQSGYRGAMRRAADTLAARDRDTYALPNDVAGLYIWAGEEDLALEWLEKGLEGRDPTMPYLNVIPTYDPLRSDPRFQELLRKMNLPVDEKR